MTHAIFGPAGNSESFKQEGFRESRDAPAWIRARGLDAYEYQCGKGVHVSPETASAIGDAARQSNITMSVHAPYYINLSSLEEERVQKNIGYVLATVRIAACLGADRMVVHCGGQGKRSRDEAMRNSHENIRRILAALDAEQLTTCTICLETMGKQSIIGSAEEVFALVAADDRLLPCIDFGHLNARSGGSMQSRAQVAALFDLMERTIGVARASVFHGHFSKIQYSDKGEVRHLTFADTVYGPTFEPVAQELAARGYTPRILCESAGTQAEDAYTMKQLYEGACTA